MDGWRPSHASLAIGGYFLLFGLAAPIDLSLFAISLGILFTFGRADWKPIGGGETLTYLLFAFVVATAVSTIAGVSPRLSVQADLSLLPGAAIFLLAAYHYKRRTDFVFTYAVFTMVAVAIAISICLAGFTSGFSDPRKVVTELGTPAVVVPNDVVLVALAAPFPMYVALTDTSRRIALVCAFLLLVLLAPVVFLRSRIGILCFAVAIATTVVLTRGTGSLRSWKRAALAISVGASAAIAIDMWEGWSFLKKFGDLASVRYMLWGWALKMWTDAPLLGQGPNSFALFSSEWGTTTVWAASGFVQERIPWAHSLPLEMLAERGILGGLLAFAIFWRISLLAASIVRTSNNKIAELAAPLLASATAFFVASLLELTMLRIWVPVFVGLVAGLMCRLRLMSLERG